MPPDVIPAQRQAPESRRAASSRRRRGRFLGSARRNAAFRAVVLLAGLLCMLAAGALWAAASLLLSLPVAYAGLRIWATEFEWGRRLLTAFNKRACRLWARAKARPVLWSLITIGGIVAAVGTSWAAAQFNVLDSLKSAVGAAA